MAEVTAKDIAKRLGLSPSAVSLALNGKPGVSDKTRIMVMDMAAELGYTLPHSVIGANTPKKSICFLIYVDRVVSIAEHTSFSTFVLRGIEATASALGYTVIVRYLYASQPIQAQISDVLNEACGIVVLGTEITKNCLSEMEAFVEYASAVPIVVLDNTLLADKVDCVCNNNFLGVQQAIRHLISQGCRRIGYLRSKQRIQAFDEREEGLRATLRDANLEIAQIVDVGISSESALLDFTAWLKTKPELPDAFFAENDVVAVAAIRALNMHNIKIPQQVAIIGFDDIPICDMTFPPLSTVHAFKETLGRVAVNTIHMRLIAGHNTTTAQKTGLCKNEISTQLRIRESTVANLNNGR